MIDGRSKITSSAWLGIALAVALIVFGIGVALIGRHDTATKADIGWICPRGFIVVREIEVAGVPACVPGMPAVRSPAP